MGQMVNQVETGKLVRMVVKKTGLAEGGMYAEMVVGGTKVAIGFDQAPEADTPLYEVVATRSEGEPNEDGVPFQAEPFVCIPEGGVGSATPRTRHTDGERLVW